MGKAQGAPGDVFNQDGTIDAANIVGSVFRRIEFRTNLTPPIAVEVAGFSPNAPASPWAGLLKPTLVLVGPSGEEMVIAPKGPASPAVGTLVAVGLVLGVFGLGYLFGRR